MGVADSNRTRLSFVREVTPGTTPASPVWKPLRVLTDTLKATVGTTKSQSIRADRQTTSMVPVSVAVGGGITMELAPNEFDDLVESSLMTTTVKTPVITNSAADTEIGDAGTTSNTFAVAAGGAAYLAGHLTRSTGFSTTANNQLFRVASSSGTTVVGAALGLVAETAPPAGASLKVVGIRAAANGSISAVLGATKTIVVATTNPATLGLAPGVWFRAAGFTGSSGANNGWYRVQTITGAGPWTVTVDRWPTGFATDAAAGQIVDLFFSDYARNGTTKIFNSFERFYADIARYMYFKGCLLDMKLTFSAEKIVTGGFDVVGMDGPPPTPTRVTSSSDAAGATSDVLTASSSIGALFEGGVQIAQASNFLSMLELAVANSGRRRPVLGSLVSQELGYGKSDITGTLTAYFVDETRLVALRNGTPWGATVVVSDPITGNGYLVDIPYGKYSDGDAPVGGESQDVEQKLPFVALMDPTLGYQIHIQRIQQ